MSARAFMCVGLLTLAGCAQQVSQLGAFTSADAAQAASIDPGNASCYQAIAALGEAVAGAKNAGILTLVAVKIAGRHALESSACAPIEAQVLADILKFTPVAPLVP